MSLLSSLVSTKNMILKSLCPWTILRFCLSSASPCSFNVNELLPSSSKELSLSKILGGHRLAFWRISHLPYSIASRRRESDQAKPLCSEDCSSFSICFKRSEIFWQVVLSRGCVHKCFRSFWSW